MTTPFNTLPKPQAIKAEYPATAPQRSYVHDLFMQRAELKGMPVDDAEAALVPFLDGLTKTKASAVIDQAKADNHRLRELFNGLRPEGKAAATALPDVPEGRYALPIENSTVGNDLAFYKVDRPVEGKWAGRTFLNNIQGPNEKAVRGAAVRTILERIAADVEGAAAAYGRAIGRCGFCHLPLTNKASRDRGIGPDCYAKHC